VTHGKRIQGHEIKSARQLNLSYVMIEKIIGT
jgi:hypothetical protein